MKKIIDWFKKAFTWVKTNWIPIVNFIVLLLIYGVNKDQLGVELLAGLWIFSLAGIYGWKWFKSH